MSCTIHDREIHLLMTTFISLAANALDVKHTKPVPPRPRSTMTLCLLRCLAANTKFASNLTFKVPDAMWTLSPLV